MSTRLFKMSTRLLMAGILVAGTLIASSTASAVTFFTGTLADWAAASGNTGVIIDADGDSAWKLFPTTSIPDGINGYITLSEVEIGGKDFYDVGVTWDASTGFPNGFSTATGARQLVYTIDVIGNKQEQIVSAAFDTVVTGTGIAATKNLRDLPANTQFLSLLSEDGASQSATFDGRTTIGVVDTFGQTQTGVFQDAHDAFTVVVPWPGALALFGIGLGGLVLIRRRSA